MFHEIQYTYTKMSNIFNQKSLKYLMFIKLYNIFTLFDIIRPMAILNLTTMKYSELKRSVFFVCLYFPLVYIL